MKKILLSACAIISAFSINAQTPGVDAVNGLVYDDFSTSVELGDSSGGIFWWGDSILGAGGAPTNDNPGFKATFTRDTDNQELDVVVTQAYNKFAPFGFGLGDSNGDGTGTKVEVDFSANSTYNVVFRNESDSTVNIRVSPQDINGKVIDQDPTWTGSTADAYKYVLDVQVAPNSSATLIAGVNNSESLALQGDFDGATKADWDCTAADKPCQLDVLDLTKVVGFNITITNANKNADDGHAHYGLVDAKISIESFAVGNGAVGLNDELSKSGVSIYPNPAVSSLNITEELENVSVFNAQGVKVYSAVKANTIDVSSFKTGVYLLKSNKGTSSFVVK